MDFFNLIILFISTTIIISVNSSKFENDDAIEAEKFIQQFKIQYFTLIREKSDWFVRILGIVGLELNYRQTVEKCVKDSCRFLIKWNQPIKKINKRIYKRSIVEILFDSNKTELIESYFDNGTATLNINKTNIDSKHKSTKHWSKSQRKVTTRKINNVEDRHVSKCTGRFKYYCQNGGICNYVTLLEQAVCNCRTGFTGKRCIEYSLSDIILPLKDHDNTPVNFEKLSDGNFEHIDSVLEATARYTYTVATKLTDKVKKIFDSPDPSFISEPSYND